MSVDDDEALRRRLSRLADEGSPQLDAAARRRVLDRVEAEGPRALRRRRQAWGGAIAAVAAAAVVLAVILSAPPRGSDPELECRGWTAARSERGRIALGRRGVVRVEGEARLQAADGCTTEITLGHGQVDVHARDLGGGALRVLADDVEIEVRGTRFTVRREGERVEVLVEEGHVAVRASSERLLHLRAGERWARGAPTAMAEPAAEPATAEPATAEPATAEPATAEPATAEPATAEPATAELATGPLAMAGPTSSEGRDARDVIADVPSGAGTVPPTHEGTARPSAAGRHSPARAGAPAVEEPAPAIEPATEPVGAREQLAQAEVRWRAGEREAARALFRGVGDGQGALAEAAWVRLARLELRAGDTARALEAARTQQRRFPSSSLNAEALWIEAEAAARAGDLAGAADARRRLQARHPGSAQARAAARAGRAP